MNGLTLDAGALIAIARGERRIQLLLQGARARGIAIVIPAGALAQAWRDGRRQARLAKLVDTDEVAVEPLDDVRARLAGLICGTTRTSDIVGASVVACARQHGHAVVTSDPDDLRRLDPTLQLIEI